MRIRYRQISHLKQLAERGPGTYEGGASAAVSTTWQLSFCQLRGNSEPGSGPGKSSPRIYVPSSASPSPVVSSLCGGVVHVCVDSNLIARCCPPVLLPSILSIFYHSSQPFTPLITVLPFCFSPPIPPAGCSSHRSFCEQLALFLLTYLLATALVIRIAASQTDRRMCLPAHS